MFDGAGPIAVRVIGAADYSLFEPLAYRISDLSDCLCAESSVSRNIVAAGCSGKASVGAICLCGRGVLSVGRLVLQGIVRGVGADPRSRSRSDLGIGR